MLGFPRQLQESHRRGRLGRGVWVCEVLKSYLRTAEAQVEKLVGVLKPAKQLRETKGSHVAQASLEVTM